MRRSRTTNTVILTILLYCFVSIGVCFANPFLYAEPSGNATDWYTLSINGDEYTVATNESLDWNFFYSIGLLDTGLNRISLQSSNENGDSDKVEFRLRVRAYKNYIVYKIIPNRMKFRKDPIYRSKFDEDNLRIVIQK